MGPIPVNSEVWGGARTSETPSPQSPGSVGSVNSQSSGYSSGELRPKGAGGGSGGGGAAANLPAQQLNQCIAIPIQAHQALQKQNKQFVHLSMSNDLWDQADALIAKGKSKGMQFLHKSKRKKIKLTEKNYFWIKNYFVTKVIIRFFWRVATPIYIKCWKKYAPSL